jgi:DNA-binding XRE family transcriptional regulator
MSHSEVSGDELRDLRYSMGFTQESFAARLGVSRNTVARWERGVLPMRRATQLAVDHIRREHEARRRAHEALDGVRRSLNDCSLEMEAVITCLTQQEGRWDDSLYSTALSHAHAARKACSSAASEAKTARWALDWHS